MLSISFSDSFKAMIDLKHVKTFLAIQQRGSFSAAADWLDIAQPTVSLHIKSLEKSLGYPLFERIGKGAVMTPAGTRFLLSAQELIRLATEAQTITAEQQAIHGELKLCVVQSICTYKMPPLLQKFQSKHPAVRLQVTVNRPSTYMLQQLRTGDFDAAIVLEAPFDIPSLGSKPLWSDQLQVVVHPHHHLAQKSTVKLAQLAHEAMIFPDWSAHYRRVFERRLQEQEIVPKTILEIDNMESIKQCVMIGMGLAILPRYAIEQEVSNGLLIPLSIEGFKLSVTAQLIWHKEKIMNQPAKEFIDMMVNRVPSNKN